MREANRRDLPSRLVPIHFARAMSGGVVEGKMRRRSVLAADDHLRPESVITFHRGKVEPGAKFADYFEFSDPLAKLPSHRILALFRGEKEEVLTLELMPDAVAPKRGEPSAFEQKIANRFKVADHGRPGDRWLTDTVRQAWRTRILVHIESDLRLRLWQAAEDAAVSGLCLVSR
jgi:protein Tex